MSRLVTRVRNLHTLIVGRTGSGKTTLARALIELAARVVVFDRKHEYAPTRSTTTESLERAAALLMAAENRPIRLVFRPRDPADYLQLLQVVCVIQESHPEYGPIVVVMEEASAYSETMSIDSRVRDAYNQGRHLSLSLLTVIQLDTDIHRVTRANSEVIVSMAQHRLSTDMRRYFTWPNIARLKSLRESYAFPPVQGKHFVTYPPECDLYTEWWTTHGYIIEIRQSKPKELDFTLQE